MRAKPKAPSDLVSDSRLATVIGPDYVEHTFYAHNISRSGPVTSSTITERWARDGHDAFLGEGTFGTVYRERCGKRLRAVKELRKSVVPGEELDCTRELEAIAKFSHPKYSRCFVMSHGWYEVDASVYIAMEYLPYGDLLGHLREPLPEVEAKTIVSQILEGLDHMHDNRFIHRDLKLGNIMVVDKGPHWKVKIADFGISKRRQEGVTTFHTMNRGTQGYAAPEVFGLWAAPEDDGTQTEGVAAPSHADEYALDMWSLGAVAYRILTKVVPFPTPADLMFYSIGQKQFPQQPLATLQVSESGIDFIRKLLVPKPSSRPSTKDARAHSWALPQLFGVHLQRRPVYQQQEGEQDEVEGESRNLDSDSVSNISSDLWEETSVDDDDNDPRKQTGTAVDSKSTSPWATHGSVFEGSDVEETTRRRPQSPMKSHYYRPRKVAIDEPTVNDSGSDSQDTESHWQPVVNPGKVRYPRTFGESHIRYTSVKNHKDRVAIDDSQNLKEHRPSARETWWKGVFGNADKVFGNSGFPRSRGREPHVIPFCYAQVSNAGKDSGLEPLWYHSPPQIAALWAEVMEYNARQRALRPKGQRTRLSTKARCDDIGSVRDASPGPSPALRRSYTSAIPQSPGPSRLVRHSVSQHCSAARDNKIRQPVAAGKTLGREAEETPSGTDDDSPIRYNPATPRSAHRDPERVTKIWCAVTPDETSRGELEESSSEWEDFDYIHNGGTKPQPAHPHRSHAKPMPAHTPTYDSRLNALLRQVRLKSVASTIQR